MSVDSLDSVFIPDDRNHNETTSKYKPVDRYTVQKDESLSFFYKAPERYRKKYCSLSEKVDASRNGCTLKLRHHSAEEYDELLRRRRILDNVTKFEKLQRDFDVTETLTKVLNDPIGSDNVNCAVDDIDLTKCIERDANLYKKAKLYTDVEYEINEAVSVIERIGSSSTDWRKSVIFYTEADKVNFAIKTAFEMEELNVKKNRFFIRSFRRKSSRRGKRKDGCSMSPKIKNKAKERNGGGSKRMTMVRYVWNIFNRKPSQRNVKAFKKTRVLRKDPNTNQTNENTDSSEVQEQQQYLLNTELDKEEQSPVSKEHFKVVVEECETKEDTGFDQPTHDNKTEFVFKIKRIEYFSSTTNTDCDSINQIDDAKNNNGGVHIPIGNSKEHAFQTDKTSLTTDNDLQSKTFVKGHFHLCSNDEEVFVSPLNVKDTQGCCHRKSVEYDEQTLEFSGDVSFIEKEFYHDNNHDDSQKKHDDGEPNSNDHEKEEDSGQMINIPKSNGINQSEISQPKCSEAISSSTDPPEVLDVDNKTEYKADINIRKPTKVRKFWKRIMSKKLKEIEHSDNDTTIFTHSSPHMASDDTDCSVANLPVRKSVNLTRTSTRLSQVLITTLTCDASDLSSLLDFAESIIKPEYDTDYTESDTDVTPDDVIITS